MKIYKLVISRIYILYRGEYRKKVGSGQVYWKPLRHKALRAAHPKIGWAVWVGSFKKRYTFPSLCATLLKNQLEIDMAGRSRSDSLYKKVEAFDTSLPDLPHGVVLSESERASWEGIIKVRLKESWNDVDLRHSVNLAKTLCKIEELQEVIASEPDIVEDHKGKQSVNPNYKLYDMLTKQAVALSRIIQVHTTATYGDADKTRSKNSTAYKARMAAESVQDDDGLLALPS